VNLYPDLRLYHFQLELELKHGREALPAYLGSTFRGMIASSFRQLVCITQAPVCDGCILLSHCAYPYMFETFAPVDLPKPLQKRFQQAPRPYIFDVPLAYQGESTLTLGLTLVGKAIDYLPYFIYAIEEASKKQGLGKSRVPYHLTKVTSCAGSDAAVIFDAERGVVSEAVQPITLNDLYDQSDTDVDELTLEFLTPLRIKKYGKIQKDESRINFYLFMNLLLGRLDSLSLFHFTHQWAPNCTLRELAREVEVSAMDLHLQKLQRYSTRREQKLSLDGLVGKITFRGPLRQFLPILKMGTYVHVGAGTAFGLGKYR